MNENIEARIFRTAKYIRSSSTIDEAMQGNTILHQSLIIDHFVQTHADIIIVSEAVDENQSGVFFERPAFQEMIADIVTGKIDCVICKDLSRLGRNFVEVSRYLRDFFPAHGIRFISINDDIDTLSHDVHDNMLVTLKNILSEHYSRDVSIKTRSALDVRRKQGDFVGAAAVYGYRKDESNKHRLVRDDSAAEVVQNIFAMKLQGMSAARIAFDLNEQSVEPPLFYKYGQSHPKCNSEIRWQPSTIFRILKNETYIGTLVQGRQAVLSFKVRKIISRPENEWIKTPFAHEAIVSSSDFENVQRLMRLDTRVAPGESVVHPLSGLLVCACCGSSRMQRKMSRYKDRTYVYYRCPVGKKNGCLSAANIKESDLFSGATEQIREYAQLLNTLDSDSTAQEMVDQNQAVLRCQITDTRKLLERNERLRDGLPDALVRGLITQEDYVHFKHSYDATVDKLNRDLRGMMEKDSRAGCLASVYADWLRGTQAFMDIMDLNRTATAYMIHRVVIGKNGDFRVHFVYQDEFLGIGGA